MSMQQTIKDLEADNAILRRQLEQERETVKDLRARIADSRAAQVVALMEGHRSAVHEPTPLTEEFLRDVGFRWHQNELQPNKMWLLWIGGAMFSRNGMASFDNFGLELSESTWEGERYFSLWFRSDIAGRYSRFLWARDLTTVEQLVRVIESLTDAPFSPLNVLYGSLHTPEQAARLRVSEQRSDWRIAKSGAAAWKEETDETKSTARERP
jgi:hypothetical protein